MNTAHLVILSYKQQANNLTSTTRHGVLSKIVQLQVELELPVQVQSTALL